MDGSGTGHTLVTNVVQTLDQLAALEPEWSALAARFATPLLEHDWFLAAAQTLYRTDALRVMVVREHGVVTGIAPLVISSTFAGRLSVLGACEIREPGGWLFSTDAALEALAQAVCRQGRVGMLQRLPPALADALPALVRGRGVVLVRRALPTRSLDTTGGWAPFLSRLSARSQRQRKNMTRRLRSAPGLTIDCVRPGPDEVEDLLSMFVPVEAAGWKGRARSALAHRPDHHAFYRTYLGYAARRGRARISSLRVDGQVVAMELAIEAYRRVWSLKIGYDERFAHLGPSLLLADAGIKAAFDQGLEGYEFLGAAEPWQERWEPTAQEYRAVTLYPMSLRGLVGLGSDAVHYLGRKVHLHRPMPSQPPRRPRRMAG